MSLFVLDAHFFQGGKSSRPAIRRGRGCTHENAYRIFRPFTSTFLRNGDEACWVFAGHAAFHRDNTRHYSSHCSCFARPIKFCHEVPGVPGNHMLYVPFGVTTFLTPRLILPVNISTLVVSFFFFCCWLFLSISLGT